MADNEEIFKKRILNKALDIIIFDLRDYFKVSSVQTEASDNKLTECARHLCEE